MDNKEDIQALFRRYLSGNYSEEDIDHLLEYFHLGKDEKRLRSLISEELNKNVPPLQHETAQHDVDKIHENILLKIHNRKSVPLYRRIGIKAAAAALLLLIGISCFFIFRKKERLPVSTLTVVQKNNASYTRYLKLSDGSTVIVKAGSELAFPPKFSGATREVVLSGEAYFDIHHDEAHPFIIHTGKITTTVLGTAFNINASESMVSVSVARGKVRVADKNKILGVLNAGRQLTYDIKKSVVVDKQVNTAQTISWAKQDMNFDGARFGDIARKLEMRYQTHIRFANPQLANCPISATFSGTESLEDVINVLCTTRGASYSIIKGEVVIDGKGCD